MKEEIVKHIGFKVMDLRKERGYKQAQMSELLGISRGSYANIEAGRQAIQVDKVYLLCCLLKVPIASVFPETKDIEMQFTTKKITVIKIKKIFKPVNIKI